MYSKEANGAVTVPSVIISRVLSFISDIRFDEDFGLDHYRWLQSLATINTTFYWAVRKVVYKTAFIARAHVPGDDGLFNFQSPTFVWLSNIKDIIKAGQEDKVRRLQVIMAHAFQCPLGLLEELGRLGFANKVWTSVRELEIHGYGFLACDTNLPDEEQATVVTCGRQFFHQHLPSIQSLKYRPVRGEWVILNERRRPAFLPLLLFSTLQFEYLGQATAVELVPPFPDGDYPPVSEDVEHLRVHFSVLDPVIPLSVPQLPTRNLKTLAIDEISRSIPFWANFVHTEKNEVCFDSLTDLEFQFDPVSGQAIVPIQYQPHGFVIKHPVLDKLTVRGATCFYTNYYESFASPRLSSLRIVEDHTRLRNVDARIIKNIKSLTIVATATPQDLCPWPVNYQLSHLFAEYSEVEEVTISGVRISIPDTLNWPNTRKLVIAVGVVRYDHIANLLLKLPCLQHLRIWCASMSYVDYGKYTMRVVGHMSAAVERTVDPVADTADTAASSTASTSKAVPTVPPPRVDYGLSQYTKDPPIPENCGLLKFEIMSDLVFDEEVVCKVIRQLPNLYSVSVNENHHEAISKFVATTGRSVDVRSFAPVY